MDQIIDADIARVIQLDTARQHTLIAWIIQHDLPDHPGKYAARGGGSRVLPFVLITITLIRKPGLLLL